MSAAGFFIEPLATHNRSTFTCGEASVDSWFRERAGQMSRRGLAAVHVLIEEATGTVAGYYTLSNFTVNISELPAALAKGMPRNIPLPAHLIGQLGVDARYQGRKLGDMLLYDAVKRAERMTGDSASLGVVVHALGERAADWYRRNGFEPFPDFPMHLILRMQDIRALP